MSLFSRITKVITGSSEPRTRILSDSTVDAAEFARGEDEQRRQRGRRGGRGRSRAGEAGVAPTSNGSNGSNGRGPSEQPGSRTTPSGLRLGPPVPGGAARAAAERERNRRDEERQPPRWRRPDRDTLDAPLPEDVAFRPATEGGDASIVPALRRPPPGAHRPGRVFYSDVSQYVPREYTEAPLSMAAPEFIEHVDHADDGGEPLTVEEGGEPRRRRRGRRGGRGRRRPGEGSEGDTPADHAMDPADASGSDGFEDDSGSDADDDLDGDGEEFDGDDEGDEYADVRGIADARADLDAVDVLPEQADEERPYVDEDELPRAVQQRRPAREAGETRVASVSLDDLGAWAELGLAQRSLEALAHFGFVTPTPIQEQTIPALLNGHDIVGVAQTGTGKTMAFGLPLMERLDPTRAAIQALVLVPTRELAQQVLDVLAELGQWYGLEAVGLLGGHALDRDFRALERRPQIVVGTPGRIIDHLQRGTLSLSDVHYAILDEADQMLDIGFLPDITRILSRTPRARQTALFSATMPHSILRLVRRYMESPEMVTISPEFSTVETVQQIYFEVAQRDKVRGLRELIDRELKGRTLIFLRTRRGVDYLAEVLGNMGVRVGALHGDMEQRRRDVVVQRFRDGELDVLIATNVAARGLDIPEITHVVNFDVPQNPEEYVHRIGRTGRAGRAGKAITFVCERDFAEFDVLLNAFGDRLQKEQLELYA